MDLRGLHLVAKRGKDALVALQRWTSWRFVEFFLNRTAKFGPFRLVFEVGRFPIVAARSLLVASFTWLQICFLAIPLL